MDQFWPICINLNNLDKSQQVYLHQFGQVWTCGESVGAGVMYYTKLLLLLVFSGSFLVNLADSLEKCCDEILISSSGPGAKYQNDRLGKAFYNSAILHLI